MAHCIHKCAIAHSSCLHEGVVSPTNKMVLLRQIAIVATLFSPTTSSPTIHIQKYGTYTGTTINQTLTNKPLPNLVDAWLGIDYASQPTGAARFAAMGPPSAFSGTRNATRYGFPCIQDTDGFPYDQDEACLNMNVFRPQDVVLDEKLPVLIWIHGVNQKLCQWIGVMD